MGKHCWKNCANRLAWSRVATNLLFVKNTISIKSTKNNNIKHKEGMSAEDTFLFLPFYYKEAAEWNEKWVCEKFFF